MVPRTRLIIWTAIVVLPFAAVAPAVPGALAASVLVIGFFLGLVAVDAVLARRDWRAIRLAVPPLVRLQQGQEGGFEVGISHPPRERMLRLGLPLPEAFGEGEHVRWVRLPGASSHSVMRWSCQARRRGRFPIERMHLESLSPLGFWAARGRQAIHCEFRVYPNLFEDRRQAAAIFLRRSLAGAHAQRFAGQGREFEKLRHYLSGDPLSDIHWKASAKRGELVTRVHQIERTHEVYVAIDASRLSARVWTEAGQRAQPALERYVSAALLLALAAERQGDEFGLITFSDQVLSCVKARSGQAHFDTCRDALYTLEPRKVSPDFEEFFTFVRLRLRKRALLIVLTALDDPVLAESFTRSCEMVARQHLVLVNLLQPAAVRPLFSATAAGPAPDVYQELAGHLQWQKLRELQKVLQRRGVRLSLLEAGNLVAQMLAQHDEVRARQLV